MKKYILMICCFICLNIMSSVFCQDTQNDSIACTAYFYDNLKEYYIQTYGTANDHAIKLTQTNQLQIDYFDVYYNIIDEAVTCVFEYYYMKESKPQYLTLGVSLDSGNVRLEFYYYSAAIEKEWKKTLKASKEQKVIVCSLGTFLKINDNEYIKYPDNQHFDKKSLLEGLKKSIKEYDTKRIKPISKSKSDINLIKAVNYKNASEVIVPGVPNYLWYMNCALTSWTMILGYWNDRGYSNFVPGGTSIDGHYWAITEELCYLGESGDFGLDHVSYYAQAKEYGNNSLFDSKNFNISMYDKNEYWDLYLKMIDSTQNPLEVTWGGPPYGAHATVGIGYKIDGDQRFLILNDTWRDVSYYVNYDEYFESLTGLSYHFPTSQKSLSLSSTKTVISQSIAPIKLESLSLNLQPPLDPAIYSYHSFELATLNGDTLEDLIVCNFRDNSGTIPLKIYYGNGTAYIEDTEFNPIMQWYECMGISRTFDYDHDGDLDFAVTGYWSYVYVFINEGDHFNSTPINVDINGRGFIDLDYGDYDLDGYVDLVSTSVDGQIRLYKNDEGTFVNDLTIALGNQSYRVKLIDVNNDYYPDLAASSRSGTVVLFYNNKGSFNPTPDFSPIGHGGLGLDIADLNNDGWPDMVGSNDGKIVVYYNTLGVFTDNPQHINDNLDCFPKDITVADLNKDNYPELLIANYNRHNIILANDHGHIDPTPVWQSAEIDPTINIRVFDNSQGERRLLFGKSRGGSLEFYKVDYHNCTQVDSVFEDKSICEGENYMGWTESGQYSRTLNSALGCDSTVITNLILNKKPITPSITQSGDTLKSSELIGNQWYFNDIEITDATSQEYIPAEYGAYHVIVTDANGCNSDKSNVISTVSTSLKLLDLNKIRIYPNPAQEILTIEGLPDYIIKVAVFDITGHLIRIQNSTPNVSKIDISELPKGMYLIYLNNQTKQAIEFVKQ
jgi:hypothetical protein